MGDYNTVNEEIRAQREKVRKMPWHKQLGHYWHYNKWIILGTAAAVILIVSMIRSAINHKDAYLTGVLMNSNPSESEVEALEQLYIDHYGVNTERYSVDFDCSLGYHIEDPTDSVSTYTPPKMLAYSEGKVGDFFLCDTDTYDFFAQSGYFADLRQVLSEDLLTQYEDRLYYYDAEDGRGEIPVAIRLETPESFRSFLGYADDEELLFSIFYNSRQPEHALEFLSLIFNN